jgi:hypothetical protein
VTDPPDVEPVKIPYGWEIYWRSDDGKVQIHLWSESRADALAVFARLWQKEMGEPE